MKRQYRKPEVVYVSRRPVSERYPMPMKRDEEQEQTEQIIPDNVLAGINLEFLTSKRTGGNNGN